MKRFLVGLVIGGLAVAAVLAAIARSSEEGPPVAPIELRSSAPPSSDARRERNPMRGRERNGRTADEDDSRLDSSTSRNGAPPARAPQPPAPSPPPPPPVSRAQPAPPPAPPPASRGADPVELPPAAAGDDDGADDASAEDGGDDGGDG